MRASPCSIIAILILTLAGLPCAAQEAVSAGKGSYASFPPRGLGGDGKKLETEPLFLVKEDGRPLPSNKWWTQLMVARFGGSLWSYPLRVDPGEKGVDLFFPIRWAPSGNDPACEFPLTVGGRNFKPADSRAKDWSDWLVSFRMGESAEKYVDVTLGEGMPYAWFEFHGVDPELSFPTGTTPKFFDIAGKETAMPAAGDCIGVEYENRHFGLFAPDATQFKMEDGKLALRFSGNAHFLAVCPLPAAKDLQYFHQYAYAIPRDTRVSWQYDPAKGMVTTTWKVTTEVLKGDEKQIIQGWIPHHYRKTAHNLKFTGIDYLSPRGKLRCAVGNEFVISYPYSGIIPNLPAPMRAGGAHDYEPGRMNAYLADLAAHPTFREDTYWGGKDILRFGQAALMARQIGNDSYKAFEADLRAAMADWFTYQPGKQDHYFASYPRWKALVGIKTSFGSEGFNDHHFHYGYFTFAAALLAMHDRQFAADFGEMAKLVAREYANWDRNDKRLPFMRTFDLWAGHSWAGGTSSKGGENQESSSEAVQSWAGLIYLGEALGDKEMTAAGIMGYAIETQATLEYWFNAGGDVFPPEWKHPVTGMVWSGGKVYGTYFTGDPAWIYAIQWLPASPMLSYLVRDPAFARKCYENMCSDYEAHELSDAAKSPKKGKSPHAARKATIRNFGPGLGSVMLGYVLMYDPDWAAEQLDLLWNEPGDKIAHDANEMAVVYYQAHAMRSLGRVDWTRRTSSPTSMVYINDKTRVRSHIVWNPQAAAQTVDVYEGDRLIGRIVAAPQALTCATSLK